MSIKIKDVILENPTVLAPMAGVTDMPFRQLCKEQGAGLLCTEMVSAKAIFYRNKNTDRLMEIAASEHPISLQIFGSEPDLMGAIAAEIEANPFDILDINMGCPVPKVVNNKEGSALLKDPQLVERIVTSVVRAIKKPVTVKIRKGFDDSNVNAVEIAKIIESCGAQAVTVHGRTREQYYSGKADWEIIRKVKDNVSIPVIGNGDIDSPQKAAAMMQETGCDGVMIGRSARGNPWLFRQVEHYLKTGELLEQPHRSEVCQMILRHARLQMELKGEDIGMREMRKHVAWYTAGYAHSASLRRMVNEISSYAMLEQILFDKF